MKGMFFPKSGDFMVRAMVDIKDLPLDFQAVKAILAKVPDTQDLREALPEGLLHEEIVNRGFIALMKALSERDDLEMVHAAIGEFLEAEKEEVA